ncbi:MAG: argininosuccinate synthase [Planctomycetota bacterium]|nr:argininosuccinate synthase [Planctomycetota bacterium]MDA1262804.1 argininosuccinate synthase [Planctomycetota bacterium]
MSQSFKPRRVSLAYSGGLDTSCIIPWLVETYGCEVIAVVADVGQGARELEGIQEKAIRSGATKCVIKDLRKAFLEEFAYPMAITGSVYEGRYLLGTSIARPIIARAQVEVAIAEDCDALSHGCTGKGNDQVRFECTFAALAPHLPVIAPWRIWNLKSREQMLDYLKVRSIPCAASAEKIYSRDANIWHISHEGGDLEDPWKAPPEDVWMLTCDPKLAPDAGAEITVSFRSGFPTALDGVPMDSVTILENLNRVGGANGVGRIDLVENRLVGMKSRGAYETPGGTILMEALRGLEQLCYDRDTMQWRQKLALDFARIVYEGTWFTPVREVLWASAQNAAQVLDGDVRIRLYKGTATVSGRRSPNSLYSQDFATFGADEVYDQTHAEGFIRLFSLPARIRALRDAANPQTAQKNSTHRTSPQVTR